MYLALALVRAHTYPPYSHAMRVRVRDKYIKTYLAKTYFKNALKDGFIDPHNYYNLKNNIFKTQNLGIADAKPSLFAVSRLPKLI